MKIDLYSNAVTVLDRGLVGLAAVLNRAKTFAAEHGLTEADLLQTRLYPNMFPLLRQAQIVNDFARQTPSRVLALDVPYALEGDMDLDEVQRQIATSRALLAGLDPKHFNGRDDFRFTVAINGKDMNFTSADYVLGFALPNFYFHYVTAYAIVRSVGVPLSKLDYFGVKTG